METQTIELTDTVDGKSVKAASLEVAAKVRRSAREWFEDQVRFHSRLSAIVLTLLSVLYVTTGARYAPKKLGVLTQEERIAVIEREVVKKKTPGLTVELVMALIQAESGWNRHAKAFNPDEMGSTKCGKTHTDQVLCATAHGLGQILGKTAVGEYRTLPVEAYDDETNLVMAVDYLARCVKKNEGSPYWAAASYHAGLHANRKSMGPKTLAHASKVVQNYAELLAKK